MKTQYLFLFLSLIAFFSSCQQPQQPEQPAVPTPSEEVSVTEKAIDKKGMIKVAILYPNGEDKTFDMDYYANKHMPMVAELFGESLQLLEIEKGISGRTPDEPMPYLAIGYFYFKQLSDYEKAFGPNAKTILSDIPNYTNIQPVVQISEVVQ